MSKRVVNFASLPLKARLKIAHAVLGSQVPNNVGNSRDELRGSADCVIEPVPGGKVLPDSPRASSQDDGDAQVTVKNATDYNGKNVNYKCTAVKVVSSFGCKGVGPIDLCERRKFQNGENDGTERTRKKLKV